MTLFHKKAVNFLKKDPDLYPIICKVGKFQIKITKNHYQSLVEAIITQQLSGAAAKSIIRKFRAIYGSRFPKPIDVIKTRNLELQRSGLSKMKINYIKDLSKKIESKEINLRKLCKMNDEDIIQQLIQIKGIGRWTAEMFLIFSLGRLDVLPVGDLGLKKGIAHAFSLDELPEISKIQALAQQWKPYRTVATWYLWKSLQKFDTIG